jgi:fructoselysine-6-P-deglycase FrlB-like protein
MEPVDPDFGCFVFGAGRERRLAETLAGYGAPVALIGAAAPGVHAFIPPPTGALAAPVLQILPVQLIVMRLAASRGLPIDGLRRQQDDTKLPTGKAA